MMPVKISFKEATIEDIPTINLLAHEIWHKHYPSIISLQQIEYMLSNRYSAQAVKEGMDAGEKYYLVNEGNSSIGYASIQKLNNSYFLHKFYLLTTVHRKGIGSAFFQYLLEKMREPLPVRLQVNRQNIKAINFYFKHGFVIEKAEDFDIGYGFKMEDFVMVRNGPTPD